MRLAPSFEQCERRIVMDGSSIPVDIELMTTLTQPAIDIGVVTATGAFVPPIVVFGSYVNDYGYAPIYDLSDIHNPFDDVTVDYPINNLLLDGVESELDSGVPDWMRSDFDVLFITEQTELAG